MATKLLKPARPPPTLVSSPSLPSPSTAVIKTPKKYTKRTLPPLVDRKGYPLLRHDPGILPPNSNIIHLGGSRPKLPRSRTQNATPLAHGSELYMYAHISTNQILYSQTRHLQPTPSMSQLTFFGKKTRPANLRKDVWLPVYMARFPTPGIGNEVFKRLGEYKRLRETAYDVEEVREVDGPRKGQLMVGPKRAQVLMDQKAKSVADLGAVLRQVQEKPAVFAREIEEPNFELIKGFKERRGRGEKLSIRERDLWRKEMIKVALGKRKKYALFHHRERIQRWERLREEKGEGAVGMRPVDWEVEEKRDLEGTEIRWADLRDAEFVAEWPGEVVHDDLKRSRYTAAWPLKERGDIGGEKGKAQSGSAKVGEAKDEGKTESETEVKKPWWRRII